MAASDNFVKVSGHSGANSNAAFSDTEWKVRCDLAACYQLIEFYGMSDLASTHISARVPGPQDHFLLNQFGLLFDQITASSLIKVNENGEIVGPAEAVQMNPAGFVIHSAIHMTHRHLICAMHTHTRANNAVAMQKDGLLPLTQKALSVMPFLRYHDFEGAEMDLNDRDRLNKDLGDGRIVILRNHGALSVGETVGEAFVWMYRLEMACRFQVDGLAGGRDLQWLSPAAIARTTKQASDSLGKGGFYEVGKLEWPSLLRKLERERGSSYQT